MGNIFTNVVNLITEGSNIDANDPKSHSISDVLIHNATVVEYNADSKFNKNKTQKYKNQIKSEFRTVDNLILTSYNPKYNNIINNYINKQNF